MQTTKPHLARDFLFQEFTRRKEKNRAYSLRAFSRSLGLTPSRLSELLNGKRELTEGQALKIAEKLSLAPKDREHLLQVAQRSPQPELKVEVPKDSAPDYRQLSDDQFHVIADWYHFAILSLMELRDFQSDSRWIAKRLGISSTEVRGALDRLSRLRLVDVKDKPWKKLAENLSTSQDIASAALRKAHRQVLEQAIETLDEVPVELRDITSITMGIDVAKIPEAKALIKEFRRKLTRFLEDGTRTEVYRLNIQLTPVSKSERKSP